MTGLFNVVRKLSSSTYIRSANIVGWTMLVGVVGVLIIVAGRYNVPTREVLLAAPGVFAAVGAVWYNMLNSPAPMILLLNVVPTDDSGSPVAEKEFLYRTLDGKEVRINPQQKHRAIDPVSSFTTPWTVECSSVASDAAVSFDVTNRGYQPVVLHEFRIEGANIEETIVPLSPENQFLEINSTDNQQQSAGDGETVVPDRQQVRPGERLSEQLWLSDLVQGDVWNRERIEFKLELYAGSGSPVDSVFVEVRPVKGGRGVEWLTHRSRLHMRIRNALSKINLTP